MLVDQLRVENAALRAALTQQAQLIPAPGQGALNNHGAHLEEPDAANGVEELKSNSAAAEAPKE